MMQIKAMVGVMLVLTVAGGGAVLYAVNAANSAIRGPGDASQGPERRRGALTSSAAGVTHRTGWPRSLLLGLLLPLVLVGLFELVLGASVLQTSIAVIRNFTDYG